MEDAPSKLTDSILRYLNNHYGMNQPCDYQDIADHLQESVEAVKQQCNQIENQYNYLIMGSSLCFITDAGKDYIEGHSSYR